MTELQAKSHAKINLYLHATGKTPNNYHTLDSMVAFAEDIYDVISVTKSSSYQLELNGPFASQLIGENIITIAVNKLSKFYNIKPEIKITLTKNLPIVSGIGGGSSNAATIIKLLSQLWQVQACPPDLLKAIGADVPMCFYGQACYASGIGEIITPIIPFPGIWAVLVNPNIHIPTPEIFKMGLEHFFKPQIPRQYSFEHNNELIRFLQPTQNDLYFNSLKLAPILKNIIVALESCDNCALARMSGSGATCFGLFANEASASNALNKLQQIYPGYFIKTTKLK